VGAAAQGGPAPRQRARVPRRPRRGGGQPIALAATKRLLQASLASSLEEALEAEAAAQVTNFGTADTAEAMAAFLEKRDPKFTGR
jgi:2-(1,2-epoxy-1,2-dihydrophenyl)acetyl-CoA isomerase